MTKAVKVVGVVALLVIGVILANKAGITKNSIRPLLPTGEAVRQELASNVEKQLFSLPDQDSIKTFADLNDYGSPRVLTFDDNGVLFTTLTGQGKVVALSDSDKNGQADSVKVVLENLTKPHGMEFFKDYLFIAEEQRVVRFNYDSKTLSASNPTPILALPADGGHFTRTIKIFDNKLYTSVGSSCNVCEEVDDRRSKILISDLDGSNVQTFTSGLRNTVFFVQAADGKLWGTEMGRDHLGDNLPPDEINVLRAGGNYGWPYCYGKKVYDSRFGRESSAYCESTVTSFFDLPAHVAPLGLAFTPDSFVNSNEASLLVSLHGSWNSSELVGYKVIKLTISGDQVVKVEDYLTGFLDSNNNVLGRPVDLVFDSENNLFVSDDKANLIYVLNNK